jgi:hypothetical protein
MRSSSECVWTVSRFYRGHRIVAVQFDGTWHVVVRGYTGAIARTSITSTSLADAMGQAEWVVETRLAFRPPPPAIQAHGWLVAHATATERTATSCYGLGMAELHPLVLLAQRLAEGRRQHSSNAAFGQWVKDNGRDHLIHRDRAALLRIGQLDSQEASALISRSSYTTPKRL